jgi:hypothetical protein
MAVVAFLLVLGVIFGMLGFVIAGSGGSRTGAATGCVVAAVSALILLAGIIYVQIALAGA